MKHKSEREVCNQKFETGDCRALFTRFYYNPETGDCEEFVYGGCGGNRNNFKTIKECRHKCISARES